MALTDNIVAYWKLDGNSEDSVASYDLTDTSVSYNASYGKIGQGANYGGSPTKSVINSDLGITGGAVTLNFWVKINGYSSGAFVSQMDGGSKVQYNIRGKTAGGNGLIFSRVKRGVIDNSITIANNTSDWQMLTLTYDNTDVKAYINGSYQSSTASSGNGTATVSDISALGYQLETTEFTNAYIDEVGIWSRALSSDEITALYNSGNGLSYPFTTTNIKKFNGVAYANIKKINGLAIANIKKINGLV